MTRWLVGLMGRLSVGRKLMLIYLLDLSAVIFVSGILIHEKFIAIDFARKELVGSAYIAETASVLLRAAQGEAAPGDVEAAERRHGEGLQTAEPAQRLAAALRAQPAAVRGTADQPLQAAIESGRALITRIGNQSNLILDPDLDSYYTMSVVLLRYPELLDIVSQMAAMREAGSGHLALEGRLAANAKAIAGDFSEAFAAATDARLRSALDGQAQQLLADIDRFRDANRTRLQDPSAAAAEAAQAARLRLLGGLARAWADATGQLDRLLHERIEFFFHRMWLHLGTALTLLMLILTVVFFVARQIVKPLRRLTDVADRVSGGAHELRASWHSRDEIGRLVGQFNDMLDQLGQQRAAQQELAAAARAAQAQQRLVEDLPVPLMVTAIPGHEVLHANAPAQAWLGGLQTDPWARGLEPALRARFFQDLADRGRVDEFKLRWMNGGPGGGREAAWVVLSARRLQYQGRDAVVTAFTPINQLKQMEARLALWAKVFEASSESILIMDADRRIITVNGAFCRQTGYDAPEVVGQPPEVLCSGADGPVRALMPMWAALEQRGAWQGELTLRRRNESTYPAWLVASAVRDSRGMVSHYICSSLDITERKASEARIHYLAHHDVLTGLPNRTLFTERLRLALQHARREGHRVAVLFIDLDRFKTINDSLGHHVGDALLRSVSQRLQEVVRDGDTVSRLGGDEFVVALGGVHDAEEVLAVVERRLIPRVREVHHVAGAELHVSCSVGMALYPDDSRDIDELMRHADVAMYQAKAMGRDSAQFFKPELNERAHRRLRIESCLRHAVERGELALHYQPRVAAPDGRLLGVEALLRWQSPELGPMVPAEVIAIAEETRLIMPVGAWVILEACRQQAQWRREGLGTLRVSINISAVQLRDASLVDTLAAALLRHGTDPASIELELTESMLLESVDHTMQQLQALKRLGVQLAIDDFGTGYSSLNYLHRFPIDRLKIDQSFVRDLLDDPTDRAITHAIIGLGHTLGLKVVAEGVESEAVAAVLRQAKCDELQGYHFARPLPPAALAGWMRERQALLPA